MNCTEVQELFSSYWDLPEDDFRRIRVDEHIKRCTSCAEEFAMWEESMNLIQASSKSSVPLPARISDGVMNRIYSDESWRIPIPERVYAISYKLRRNLTAVFAFCLALFLLSFLYSFIDHNAGLSGDTSMNGQLTGLLPVANAQGEFDTDTASSQSGSMGLAVASLSDPLVLKVGPIETTYPNYFLVLSLLGLICALLIMNWLSRIKG